MKKLVLLAIVSAVMLVGCIPQKIWHKPGGVQSEFDQVRYACLRQSQQRVSHAEHDQGQGVADSQMQTNLMLFESCMNSKGWHLVDARSVQPITASEEPPVQQPAAKNEPTQAKQATKKQDAPSLDVPQTNTCIVTASTANLRSGPSLKHQRIGSLKKGDFVEVMKRRSGWVLVKASNGSIGWCCAEFINNKK